MSLAVIILAAGKGSRMKSPLPKVLHPIGGVSMIERVIQTAQKLQASQCLVVHGHETDSLKTALAGLSEDIGWVNQPEPKGTGDAVRQALAHLDPRCDHVLVLFGDVPMISVDTLNTLIQQTPDDALGILTLNTANPKGLGRILRNESGHIQSIVEERDASEEQRKIQEVNTGIFYAVAKDLKHWLPQLSNQNAQQEFYLTDIVQMAQTDKRSIISTQPRASEEVQGVNDRVQWMHLERYHQKQMATNLMKQGVGISDSERLDIRGDLTCGANVFLDINVIIEGQVTLEDNVYVGAGCVLKDCHIQANTQISPYCVIDGAQVGPNNQLGPFLRLRPGTKTEDAVKLGNFVELKNTTVAMHSKASHFAYLGDAQLGERVNVGAFSVTCNYDGANKHVTTIESDAFVGSGTQLVAPVVIEQGATIGAGTTLTKTAPKSSLTVGRSPQKTLSSWERPVKQDNKDK